MNWKQYLQEWSTNHSKTMPVNLRNLRNEFIQRFPKEKISELTLDEYALGNHEKNPDSFSTWIEFKTNSLGSIAGGSANKHGIYWSKQDNYWRWNKSFGVSTPEEALEKIKIGLAKLVQSVEEDRLQDLDQIADNYLGKNRNTLRSKPLYLYYPEKFIPIFSSQHLDDFLGFFGQLAAGGILTKSIKLYQYLKTLKEFSDFDSWGMMCFLYDFRSHILSQTRSVTPLSVDQQFWKISPGEKAWFWEDCLNGEFISIGWEELGDMSLLTQDLFYEKSKELIQSGNRPLTQQALNQVWKFANDIKIGDRILANRGTKEILGIGTVTGNYYWTEGEKYPHRLPVQWDDTRVRDIDEKGWVKTLIPVQKEKFLEILNQQSVIDTYSLKQLQTDVLLDEKTLDFYVRSLRRKRQIVISGSPGAGKTFLAKKLARHLISESDGFVEIVQFHPAYTYEDFIQGLRPTIDEDENLRYELAPGRFLEFCEKARIRGKNNPCVLIIDEINRANLSAVFGELMYLLEYRDQEIKLAGSNEPFSIPENVYIIGTMNTADRSIALVDHALRRRFAFIELRPDYDILRKWHEREETGFDVEPLITQIKKVNEAIDDRHYNLGFSYFLDENLKENIADIWKLEIYPYLEELFYGKSEEELKPFQWKTIEPFIRGESTTNG